MTNRRLASAAKQMADDLWQQRSKITDTMVDLINRGRVLDIWFADFGYEKTVRSLNLRIHYLELAAIHLSHSDRPGRMEEILQDFRRSPYFSAAEPDFQRLLLTPV